AGLGVEHDHATIAIAVGNEHLVGLRIHGDARGPAQMLGAVAVSGDAALADLEQELSVPGEFEDLPVPVAVARQPDVVLRIDRDAVFAAAGTSIAVPALFGRAGRALRKGRIQSPTIKPFVPGPLRRAAPSLD